MNKYTGFIDATNLKVTGGIGVGWALPEVNSLHLLIIVYTRWTSAVIGGIWSEDLWRSLNVQFGIAT